MSGAYTALTDRSLDASNTTCELTEESPRTRLAQTLQQPPQVQISPSCQRLATMIIITSSYTHYNEYSPLAVVVGDGVSLVLEEDIFCKL